MRRDEFESWMTTKLKADSLEKAGFTSDDLFAIHSDHFKEIPNLQLEASSIVERLRRVSEVHSLKYRIKDAGHLIEKIVRKRLEEPTFEISLQNYREKITDLIGIRALHLFKEDWEAVHDFITSTWELQEPPTTNIRKGDPEPLIKLLTENGCQINEHKFGYRSVHYLMKSQPTKAQFIAEIQVRTIFEEAWSEIDHRIRYPNNQDNVILAQYLVMFNRLAGSADEMGSYVTFLKQALDKKEAEFTKQAEAHNAAIAAFKKQIDELQIDKTQKEELERRLAAVERSNQNRPTIAGSLSGLSGLSAFNDASYGEAIRKLAASASFSPLPIIPLDYLESIFKKNQLFEDSIKKALTGIPALPNLTTPPPDLYQ